MEGKVALVTGAASGIGRATAVEFASKGARVAVADLSEEGGRATVGLIEDTGGEAAFFKADVSRAGDVERLVAETVKRFGRLDYAHNNAGIEGVMAPVHELSEEDWNRVIAVNLTGVWLCMKYEIPELLKQGGAIVNTSSVAGLVGAAGAAAYGASKHGVAGLTKAAALEYATQGIRVNAVCPGVIMTPMVERAMANFPGIRERFAAIEPIGRPGQPSEVAAAVVWLCSDAASFVTGHMMVVDGGIIAQ